MTMTMNPVLERILSTQTVNDGAEAISLRHPEFPDKVSHIGRSTGELLQRAIADVKPAVSLEIGLAYGVSTLYICEAIAGLPRPGTHVVMDPFQNGKWRGIGLRNLEAAGFRHLVEFLEERSEIALPRLVAEGRRVDLAFIDGLHRYDQAFVEFYFVNQLLRPGGVVLFDDAVRPSVKRVIRHALSYPCYEIYASTETAGSGPSTLGRLRAKAGRFRSIRKIVRPDVITRDWDLGVLGRCVGLRKIAEDQRGHHWDAES
jgi:predicted O-methyltransferase YrrM